MTDTTHLLVVNETAGSVDPDLISLLESLLPSYRRVPFPERADELDRLSDGGRVAVCGGDGTVTQVVRRLSGRAHQLAIIPAGTFNNVARSLGIPDEPEAAAQLAATGRVRPCTVGVAGQEVFVEAALIGALGGLLALGEAAKEMRFHELAQRVRDTLELQPFHYRITGDVHLRGRATSVIVANTPTTGSRLQVAAVDPFTPELELRIQNVPAVAGLLSLLTSDLRRRRRAPLGTLVRHLRIETDPPVPVVCDALPVGSTPLEIRAWPSALSVVVPNAPGDRG